MRGLKEQQASDYRTASGHDAALAPALAGAVDRHAGADLVPHRPGRVGVGGDGRRDAGGLHLRALLGGHRGLVPGTLDDPVGADEVAAAGLDVHGLLPAPAPAPALLLAPAAVADEAATPGTAVAAAVHRTTPPTGCDAAGSESGEDGDERETSEKALHEWPCAFSPHRPVRAVSNTVSQEVNDQQNVHIE